MQMKSDDISQPVIKTSIGKLHPITATYIVIGRVSLDPKAELVGSVGVPTNPTIRTFVEPQDQRHHT